MISAPRAYTLHPVSQPPPASMRAVVLREFGPPSVLRLERVPVPEPGAGEVLVRVGAVSINRSFDLRVRQDGDRRGVRLPLVLGNDPTGEVVALGPGVAGVRVGERVAVWRPAPCGACDQCRAGREQDCLDKRFIGVHRWGGDAELLAVPASTLERLPPGLPYAEATVVVRHAPTAIALADRAGLHEGESALVMGAAGGLGSMLVQVAKRRGARVLAGAGSDERVQLARDLGADAGVNYRRDDLVAAARRFTDGRGVDVVFENIADPTLWPSAFASLGYGGRLATVGAHGGGDVTLDVRRLYTGNLNVLGGAFSTREHLRQALAAGYKAVLGPLLPLEEAARAHELAESGRVPGKVLLDPNGLAAT
jgi:NADPH:quinone reductase